MPESVPGDRDPYSPLVGQDIAVILRNGERIVGKLIEVTYSFVSLKENGGTCVLRRDVIDVIRTTRADSPQARDVRPHGESGVGKVTT